MRIRRNSSFMAVKRQKMKFDHVGAVSMVP